jgi:hypothetical protein
MSYPWEYYEPVEEGNPGAGLHAGLWALGTYVAMLVVVLPREHAHTDAFMSGRLLAPAVIVWLVTWVVAHNIKTRWRWWVYPLIVPTATLALVLFSSADELIDRAKGRTADGGTRTDQGPVLAELVVPESEGKWTKVESPEVKQARQTLIGRMDELGEDIDSAVLGYYSLRSPNVQVVYEGINGTVDHSASFESVLEDAMTGAGVEDYDTFDPGSAEGVLGCGGLTRNGQSLVECMWIGNERAVVLTWIDGELDHKTAADLTVEFRGLASAG